PGRRGGDLDTQVGGDRIAGRGVCPAREKHQVLSVLYPLAHWLRPSFLELCRVRSAASAEPLSGRLSITQASMFLCRPPETARAPGGTSFLITVPAPEYAPSPTVTGATNMVSEPVRQ